MKSVMLTPIIGVALLSTSAWCNDGVHLINRLNDFYGFDDNIFLMGPSTELDDWFPVPSSRSENRVVSLTPKTVYVFNDDFAKNNFTVAERAESKCCKNTFLVVVAQRVEIKNGLQLLTLVRDIRDVDINVRVGVFYTGLIDSLDIVDELFRWSWSIGLVNIFSAFYFSTEDEKPVFNVFTYNPFRSFELINSSRSEQLEIYFTDKRPNYRQQPLRFVFFSAYHVYELKLWDTVCRHFNASLSQIRRSYEEILKSPWLHEDIILHSLTMKHSTPNALYLCRNVIRVALVPHSQPYSDFVAYLKSDTWAHLLVYFAILILASSCLLIVSGYLHKKKILFFQCITDVINLLINDNSAIKYRNLTHADVFVVVPWTFTGLIVVNGILSAFQSYMTSPIYQPQINSVKDLYETTVPILVNDYGWKDSLVMILEDLTNFGGWIDKIQAVPYDQLTQEAANFNNSFAEFTFIWQAQIYLEAQKRLGLKFYHLLREIPVGRSPSFFQFAPNFPFGEPIQDTIHRLNCAGLIDKWMEEDRDHAVRVLVNRNIQRRNHEKLKVNEISAMTMWYVVSCGWILSAFAFICELIWCKIKLRMRNYNEREVK